MVLKLLKGEINLAQIAKEGCHTQKQKGFPAMDCQNRFLDNTSIAFEGNSTTARIKEEKETLKKRDDALVKKLGETTIERLGRVEK